MIFNKISVIALCHRLLINSNMFPLATHTVNLVRQFFMNFIVLVHILLVIKWRNYFYIFTSIQGDSKCIFITSGGDQGHLVEQL